MAIKTRVRATFPKHKTPDWIFQQLAGGFKEIGEAALLDFQRTTKTWEHQVVFTITKLKFGIEVGTTDQQYIWVNNGTPPHDIVAKNAPFLKFQSGFTPKTSVGFIGSNKGSHFGDFRYPKKVKHPGAAGRYFDAAIADKWAQKTGHILKVSISSTLEQSLIGYQTIVIG